MHINVFDPKFPMYTQLVSYPQHSFYYGPTYIPPTYCQYPSTNITPYYPYQTQVLSENYLGQCSKQQMKNGLDENHEAYNSDIQEKNLGQSNNFRILKRKQNPNRNLNSNILKHFLKYLNSCKKAEEFICKLIKVHKLSISYKNFIGFLNSHLRNSRNYIKPSLIQKLCHQNQKHKAYSLLLRIMVTKFLKNQLSCVVFNSNKDKKYEKIDEVKTARNLLKYLVSYYK